MTNEKWKYVLNSDSLKEYELQTSPDGWNIQRVNFTRNLKYLGVFRPVTTSLRFFGDGREYIQTVYERNGTEHEITIQIYQYKSKPDDKFELFYEGIIDLSTYANEQDKFVECDINETSFARKLISRDDIEVDLTSVKSIDGEDLIEGNQVTVNLHQRELLNTGSYNLNEQAAEVESVLSIINSQGYDGLTLPITLFSKDDTVDNLSSQDNAILGAQGSAFYDPLGRAATVTAAGSVVANLENIFVTTSTISVSFKFWVYEDDTLDVIKSQVDIPDATFLIPSGDGGNIDVSFEFQNVAIEDVTSDNVISFVLVSNESVYRGYKATFTKSDMTVLFNQQWKDISQAQGFLMHEVGQQLTKIITGRDKYFSQFFGREDIGYQENGEGSYVTLHGAQEIRRLPNATPKISLSDWYTSMSAIYNIGLGIEYNDVGQPFVRVEKLDHFFNGDVTAEIHQVTKLTKVCAREWIFNSLKVGYNKSDTEISNGLEEYNNLFEWSTFIKSIKNEGEFESKIRTDGYGIEKLRRLGFDTNPTEDTREDNDNFAVTVFEDGTDTEGNKRYRSVKDELYDIVENIFSPETAYNLDLTPGRNLRRNGSKIRAGLEKYLTNEIKFQKAEQKANLVSKRNDEDEAITENADILPSDLAHGRWIPDIYTCEFLMTSEIYKAFIKNPGGIVKLSSATSENTTNYNYGWILDVGYNAQNKRSTGEFLRVNLNNPDLTLKDPFGNSPETVPPIQPESGEDYGFEGGFPFVFLGGDQVQTTVLEFTGNEQLTIGGITALERTSTFYFKGIINIDTGSSDAIHYDTNQEGNVGGVTVYTSSGNAKAVVDFYDISDIDAPIQTSFNNPDRGISIGAQSICRATRTGSGQYEQGISASDQADNYYDAISQDWVGRPYYPYITITQISATAVAIEAIEGGWTISLNTYGSNDPKATFTETTESKRLNFKLEGSDQTKLHVESTSEVVVGQCYLAEVIYTGTSLASGVTLKLNGGSAGRSDISDNLAASTAITQGAWIGKTKGSVNSNHGGYKLNEILVEYDDVGVFETNCEVLNYDRNITDLSGAGNDGLVSLNNTDEVEFYTNNSCVPPETTTKYAFSGIEKVSIPNVPDFEKTSTLYFKSTIINKTGSTTSGILFDNQDSANGFVGLLIYVTNPSAGPITGKKLVIQLRDNSGGSVSVTTEGIFNEDESKKAEIFYNGNGAASGVTINVDDTPVTKIVASDDLVGNISTGSNGYTIGLRKTQAGNNNAFHIDDLEMTFDGTKQFETNCEDNGSQSLTCTDLSGQGNNGTIELNGTDPDNFFIN